MMKKTLFEDALILKTVKTLRVLAHILPLGVSFSIARGVGAIVYFFGKRRKIAYQNLKAAFGAEKSRLEMKKIAFRSVQNLSMSAVELLRFPDMDETYIRKNIRIHGTEKIDEKLREGKGAIFLTAHFGCWELLNIASNLVGYPMVVLARTQKHPRSDEFLNSLRTSKGNQIIHKGMPVREILKALKAGKIVGMLSDQDGGRNGTFVRFFGRMSSSPSGVATFALRTHAPIFPVFIFREGGSRHRVEVGDPLKRPADSATPEEAEQDILQQFARILESQIRKAPDQWLWAHRRWKSTPDRSILVLSDGKQGHLNQSLAVLRAITEGRAAKGVKVECTKSKVVEVNFKNTIARKVLGAIGVLFGGRIPFGSWVLKAVLQRGSYESLIQSYADVIVSCGSSLLGVHAILKAENQSKSIVVMKPSFAADRWEAVIVPRHDRMKSAENIFVTEAALSRTSEKVREEASFKLSQELKLHNGNKKIGFLIGGDTESVKFSKRLFEKVLSELKRYSGDTNSYLLATSSRRTPAWADALLKSSLKESRECPLLVIPNEANPSGAMAGILGLSDVLVVSGESMSMVSEAVVSGKPVIVFPPSEKAKMKPKYEEFLDRMVRKYRVVRSDAQDIYRTVGEQLRIGSGPPAEGIYQHDHEVLQEAVRRVV